MYKKFLVLLGTLILLNSVCFAHPEKSKVNLGIYEPKLKAMDMAIKQNPDKLINYINKAELHLRFYQLEEAKKLYKKALKIAKNDVTRAYLEGAILYCDLQLDEAAQKFDEIIAKHPECKRSTFMRGLIALQKGDDKKALKCFEKVLQLDSNNLEAMNQIAWIYMSQADYDKAIEYFNQILYRDEHYMSALDGKGYALYKLGLFKEALPYVNEVIIFNFAY